MKAFLELAVGLALIVAIVLVISSVAAEARSGVTQCQSAPDRGARRWWAYRQVAGRRCWYQGRPGRSKDTLAWGEPEPKEPRRARGAPPALAAAPAIAPGSPPVAPPAVLEPEAPKAIPTLTILRTVPVAEQLKNYRAVADPTLLPPLPLPLPPLPPPKPIIWEMPSPLWLLVMLGLAFGASYFVSRFHPSLRRSLHHG